MCESSLKYSFNGSFERGPGQPFILCSLTYVITGIERKSILITAKKEEVPSKQSHSFWSFSVNKILPFTFTYSTAVYFASGIGSLQTTEQFCPHISKETPEQMLASIQFTE